jgi:glutamate-5-semialdehyde dehydrogenase
MIADKRCFLYLPSAVTTLADEGFGFNVEHLSLTLSVKCVDSMDEAITFINHNSSHHTDVILTSDEEHASQFCLRVDSAGVYHNCSSRFADGFRYGFGAEVGVSTNRVHARGPVGMEGLLTYKYILKGNGQVVGGMKPTDYTHRELDREFLHKPLNIFDTGDKTKSEKRIKMSE